MITPKDIQERADLRKEAEKRQHAILTSERVMHIEPSVMLRLLDAFDGEARMTTILFEGIKKELKAQGPDGCACGGDNGSSSEPAVCYLHEALDGAAKVLKKSLRI